MKKTIILLLMLMMAGLGYSQTANGFNFKALVTNNGNPVASGLISVKVTFKEGTIIKWQETHSTVHTDANGIFSIVMGEGTHVAGVTSFDKVDWNVGNMNYTVEVDTGSGYQTLVSNEYFKRVPFAKVAERLAPTDYDVITNNQNIWAKNDGTGAIAHGFRLSHGTTDWYMYMKADDGFALRKDASDYLGFDATSAKAWFKGSLDLPSNGIIFRSTSGSYTNSFSLTTLSDGLAFKYNNAQVMKMHGSASVEVMKKLRAPDSGDSDMKAYIYGKVYSNGSIPGSTTPNSDGFSVQKTGTGVYKITFTHSPGSFNKYLVIPSIYGAHSGMVRGNAFNNYFNVITSDASGNAADRDFTFVVYKK